MTVGWGATYNALCPCPIQCYHLRRRIVQYNKSAAFTPIQIATGNSSTLKTELVAEGSAQISNGTDQNQKMFTGGRRLCPNY